ncbi:MAG TPA: type II secretion system F family protein [Microbacteriaceae bacterium]|nr:type II secretion system F family protein [Microbacteriaceae bacterium]
MTAHGASWAAILGLLLGLGAWCLLAALPRFRRPSLAARVAPALLDVSPAAAADVAARGGDTALPALLRPLRALAGRLLARLTGGSELLAAKLRAAGQTTSPDEYRTKQVLWLLGGAALGSAAVFVILGVRPIAAPFRLLLPALCALGGLLARDQVLHWSVRARRQRIVDEFPTILDFLALCLSAGEGIRDALERVARAGTGEFSRELAEVAAQTRTGVPLAQALRALGARIGVPALSRCVDAVVAALEHGSPLAGVLRAQANDVREEAKRVLLESAGRKEIAMMIPLVFLILPVTVLFAIYPGVFVLQAGF